VDLPFREFIPVFRAKTKADADPFNPASVVSIQVPNPYAPFALQWHWSPL